MSRTSRTWRTTAAAAIGLLVVAIAVACAQRIPPAQAQGGSSLRFFGSGVDDIDRVKIPIDAPPRPADVGGSFTIEFWMRADPDDVAPRSCAASASQGDAWITGHIIIDRDTFDTPDNGDFGISLYGQGGGRIAFGVDGGGGGATLCGGDGLADGAWHHIAVTRDSGSGLLQLYADGLRVAQASGPTGDVSYADGRATSYPNSDPFLVIGAEKHDAGSDYPSFSGWVDELRISRVVRYSGASFTRPSAPFATDADTVALYHFDEGAGATLTDTSGAAGGPSDGEVRFTDNQSAPQWSSETPWGSIAPPTPDPDLLLTATALTERSYLPAVVQ